MTEQEKLKKVINGLESTKDFLDTTKSMFEIGFSTIVTDIYDNALNAISEALELLKARKPRVMTWQEVVGSFLECKPVYIETNDSEYKEPSDDRWAMVTQCRDSLTNGMIRAMSPYVTSEVFFKEDYNKDWRCWTSRPDENLKEAVMWES